MITGLTVLVLLMPILLVGEFFFLKWLNKRATEKVKRREEKGYDPIE